MKMRFISLSLCSILLFTLNCSLFAETYEDCCYEFDNCYVEEKPPRHFLAIGPEVYHVKRTREGGTRQTGVLGGGRIDYDYLRSNFFYFGGEASYAKGELEGHTGLGRAIKSRFSDTYAEGRAGFTFNLKRAPCLFFSPFLGVAYLEELNCFINPSPLPIRSKIRTSLALVGFLANYKIGSYWNVGLNFKAKWMLNGKNLISNDPKYDSLCILIKNKMQYTIELPIAYQICNSYLRVTPFYETRHYGRQVYYPFDFLDTKLYIVGAIFDYVYSF